MPDPIASPCPFCGSKIVSTTNLYSWWWTYCQDCKAQGPNAKTPEEAVEKWNEAERPGDYIKHAIDMAFPVSKTRKQKG